MSPERLLQYFERISEAPDAIPRLRRFILDLAVRGKLVEQNPDANSSQALAKTIRQEAAELRKAGLSREPKRAVEIQIEQLPFAVPSTWVWIRLIEIADVSYGYAFESSKFNDSRSGIPLIRIRDISNSDTEVYFEGDYDPAYIVNTGDMLVGMDGAFNLRKWRGGQALLNQRVMRMRNWRGGVLAEYVSIPLQMIFDFIHSQTSLTTVKHLSAKQVNGIPIPLPPLAEQHRIVAKVDELMALCDELEAAQAKREDRRARLVAATLHGLNNGDTEPGTDTGLDFTQSARFYLNHLPRLTTRPEHVHQLRQTILNLAVRGKLVPQNPEDGSAEELIKRATAYRSKQRVRTNDITPLSDAEIPYAAPRGWKWARFGQVFSIRTGFAFKSSTYSQTGVLVLRVTNFDWSGAFNLSEAKFFPQERIGNKLKQFLLKAGDILMVMVGGTIGKTTKVSPEILPALLNQNMWRIRSFGEVMDNDFEYLLVRYLNQRVDRVTHSTHGHFAMSDFKQKPVCIPPLAEQHRIVAKVDELMALCDELEAHLTTAATTRARLLDATLHETLHGTGDTAEAAMAD